MAWIVLIGCGTDHVSVPAFLTVFGAVTAEAKANPTMRSRRCVFIRRGAVLRPTAGKPRHPANPAHEPEPSRLLPYARIAGRPAGLARALQAAGSSLRFRGRDQTVSYVEHNLRLRNRNDNPTDFHLEASGLEQPLRLRLMERCCAAPTFSGTRWNQKPGTRLVLSGSTRRVPCSGCCHVLFDGLAGPAEESEAAHRGNIS